jgi:predicted nucleotidyltransferase
VTKSEALSILENHKSDFADRFGVERIGVFGSVARDEATENSDVDVIAQMPPNFGSLIELQEELEKELGPVDEILKEGRIKEITKWLNEKIHWYGSTRTPKEVIANVCGKEVSAEPLVRYFEKKYASVYDLK